MLETIKAALRNYLVTEFMIEEDDPDLTDDVHLFDYGFVDSLGAMKMILFLEETYHIEITQSDITLYPMNTISEIAAVVNGKLEQCGI